MTETITPTSKLDTVRKLLAKAERAGTPEEAEAFAEKASELMIRYSIDEALLASHGPDAGGVTSRSITLDGYPMAKGYILDAVARGLGCRMVLRTTDRSSVKIAVVYGWPADLEAFDLLATSLLLQATTAATYEHKRMPHVHGKTFRQSFLLGFARTVGSRMQAQRQQAKQEATGGQAGAALVLVDRSRAVDRVVADAHPRTSKSRSSVTDAGSYSAGQAAGSRADLGGQRIGGRSRAAIR